MSCMQSGPPDRDCFICALPWAPQLPSLCTLNQLMIPRHGQHTRPHTLADGLYDALLHTSAPFTAVLLIRRGYGGVSCTDTRRSGHCGPGRPQCARGDVHVRLHYRRRCVLPRLTLQYFHSCSPYLSTRRRHCRLCPRVPPIGRLEHHRSAH